jgi:diguanylate cyclase (GGDEF)-like protein
VTSRPFQDARLQEMKFLSQALREGRVTVTSSGDATETSMVMSLLLDGCLNGIETVRWEHDTSKPLYWNGQYQYNSLLNTFEQRRLDDVAKLLSKSGDVSVLVSHKGRVRLSELQQQLKTGRDRDPTGLCLARRHLLTDLAIALTAADKDAPLSVVFIDMNGLKTINDTHGHRAGDDAIRAYLEAVVATFGEHGEAYRGEGGDEAVVVLPNTSDEAAGKFLATFVRQLGKDVLMLGGAEHRLTASCGSASTTDPNADSHLLHDRADAVQYRAKAESKKQNPRVSAFAVDEGDVATYAPGT